jgi:hypothetical protein
MPRQQRFRGRERIVFKKEREMLDFNDAPAQREFVVVPEGIYAGTLNVKPGGAGPDGVLTRSQSGEAEMLVIEFIIDEGEYAETKVFDRLVVGGTTEGHAQAAEISRGRIRAVIESARGVHRNDTSPEAIKARTLTSYMQLHGLRCLAELAVEPERKDPKTGQTYAARNAIWKFITPDRVEWRQLTQTPQEFPGVSPAPGSNGPAPGTLGQLSRPEWAK